MADLGRIEGALDSAIGKGALDEPTVAACVKATAIAAALAACEEPSAPFNVCHLCGAALEMARHDEDCPWVLAVSWQAAYGPEGP